MPAKKRKITVSKRSAFWPCGSCRQNCTSGIQCDACKHWYHAQCEGLSEDELKFLSRSSAPYTCEDCFSILDSPTYEYLYGLTRMRQCGELSLIAALMEDSDRGVKRSGDPESGSTGKVKWRKLGRGACGTPTEIEIIDFAEGRAAEIKALEEVVNIAEGGKNVIQKLPRHMRRRAMSHNIKRLPKNLRAFATFQYANQEGKKKKPSRYHRRRPKNLLEEYTRRQRKSIWLETHIWHAKRFHMIEKWGHKLPWKPTDKSERAAYRATSKHCLLQDMSYMCCIELMGEEQNLLMGLAHLTSPETGPTFASKACLPGTRAGNTVLYQYDEYPYNCLGPISFLWKPQLAVDAKTELGAEKKQPENTKPKGRKLWLWCHPACFDLVWQGLLRCFDMKDRSVSAIVNTVTEDTSDEPKIDKTDERQSKIKDKTVNKEEDEGISETVNTQTDEEQKAKLSGHSSRATGNTRTNEKKGAELSGHSDSGTQPSYSSKSSKIAVKRKMRKSLQKGSKTKTGEVCEELKPAFCDKFKSEEEVSNGEVAIKSLAGSLLRYKLTGPESNAVLFDALQQANIVPVSSSGDAVKWWHKYYDTTLSLGHELQREFWESVSMCQSPAELSPHCVLGLTVADPRLTRPVKRTKITSSETDIDSNLSVCKEKVTVDISSSPIWDSSVRKEVLSTKMSDHQINKQKEENLVSGFPLNLGDDESKIPLLLIQNPGVSSPVTPRSHDPAVGRGSGWDIIIPKGWGKAFWLSLVYRGARCGGIHELENNALEESSLLYPHDFPDSVGGKKHQLEVEFLSVEKYNRRPPSKRPNYVKLGVVSPFYCPWLSLVKSWHEIDCKNGQEVLGDSMVDRKNVQEVSGDDASATNKCNSYFVLRDKKLLRKLGTILEMESTCNPIAARMTKNPLSFGHSGCNKVTNGLSKHQSLLNEKRKKLETVVFAELREKCRNSLVSVRVDVLQKGTPARFAQICIPSQSDLEALQSDKAYGGPTEQRHIDQKKVDFQTAKRELKKSTGKKKLKIKLDHTMKLFSDSENDVTLQINDRKIIGFLNSGGFSLGLGNGHGVGFCSALGLQYLIEGVHRDVGLLVLVRNPSSFQYRFAKLSLIY